MHRDQPYPWLDLRADDHPDPLAELRRLYDVAHERFSIVAKALPALQNPHGWLERGSIDQEIREAAYRREAESRESRSFGPPLVGV